MLNTDVLSRIKDSNIEIKIAYLEQILEPIVDRILERRNKIELEAAPMMTIADVAKKFKVTKTTVQNWIRRGTITGRRLGKNRYFSYEEVAGALAQNGWTNFKEL